MRNLRPPLDTCNAACNVDDPAGFAPASLDDIDDPAVLAWVEACAEVWGATELAEQARDTAVGRAHDLAHEAARAHYWRDELASIYRVVPLGLSATPGAWLRWISEGRDAASLRPWATPRTWTEDTADPVSLVLANLRGANLDGANLEGANLEGADTA